MKKIVNKIAGFISGVRSADGEFVVGNSIRLFFLYGISVCLGFLSNYVLIKWAGVEDYGAYVYLFNLVSLAANFCLLGVDTLLVKNFSVFDAKKDFGKLKGTLLFSFIIVLISSLAVAFVLVNGNFVLKNIDGRLKTNWFAFVFLSCMLLSLTIVSQAALQALKKISLSQLMEKVIRPVALLIIVFALFSLGTISLTSLVWSNITAFGLTCAIGFLLLFKQIGPKLIRVKSEYNFKPWLKSALAFFTISVLFVLNSRIDIFFLGLLKGNREVGVYNILVRVSEITGVGLIVINFVLTPLVARLFANGNTVFLQTLITRSSRVVLLISLPATILIIILRDYILGFFGVNFMNAGSALTILCLGQLVNAFCGSVGLLLIMSGKEKFSIIGLAVGTVTNILLDVVFIPPYGIIGAAIATSFSLVVWNSIMYFYVRSRLHIKTTAIGSM